MLIPTYSMGDVKSDTISLDAKDADIKDILLGLARNNDINLVMDESVQGRLTISLNGLSPIETIELILRSNGFAVEEMGDMFVAGTSEQLKNMLPPISKIIGLKYASASEVKESLGQVASGQASIQTDVRTNSLIVTGTASGISAVEQAIELLDVQMPSEPQITTTIRTFPLEHVQASAIKALVSELCSPAGKLLVDDRANSLVITDEVSVMEPLAEAIKQLDVPSPLSDEESEKVELHTRVFRPDYIDANALKETLQDMLSPDGKIQAFVRQKKSMAPTQSVSMGVTSNEEGGALRTSVAPDAEKWSDVLIVTDTADSIERIDALITALDTRTPQVMIEAKMVEVNLNDIMDIGMNWQARHAPSKATLGVEMPRDKTEGMNLQIGTLSIGRFEDIMLEIQALETSGQAKLISHPSVITLDNELAQMIVADRIPVPTTHETEFSATTSYEFINIGIILTVTPHITEDGYILMDAMPEVNSIKDWTTGENPQPIISSRMAHTRVRVKDGQTFVIGGLIKDEQRETVSRVPILHAIPLLGRLFRSRGIDNVKTDLVVFITPRVCRDN